jgi:hypothetical protein
VVFAVLWVGELVQEESCALHRSALRYAGGLANAGCFSSQIVGRIGHPWPCICALLLLVVLGTREHERAKAEARGKVWSEESDAMLGMRGDEWL